MPEIAESRLPKANSPYILIADSGSTKTDWIIKHSSDKPVQFQSVGMNPFYQTEREIISILGKEVIPNLPFSIDHVFFYGAGCADETTSRPITNALMSCIPSLKVIEVSSDMLGAARGLCGHEPGLACILGTGANNAVFDGEKIVRSIGSLGFWLGDEGSGSYLGKTLVVHYLQNELPEDLHQQFASDFPEINRLTVLDNAYKKPFPNRYFATFSKFIAEHIDHIFVQQLVTNAFEVFVEKYVLKHQNVETYPVHFTGSIAFYYQDILKNILLKKGLIAGKILKSPLEGLLAYHL